jgi:hypothetical protein
MEIIPRKTYKELLDISEKVESDDNSRRIFLDIDQDWQLFITIDKAPNMALLNTGLEEKILGVSLLCIKQDLPNINLRNWIMTHTCRHWVFNESNIESRLKTIYDHYGRILAKRDELVTATTPSAVACILR